MSPPIHARFLWSGGFSAAFAVLALATTATGGGLISDSAPDDTLQANDIVARAEAFLHGGPEWFSSSLLSSGFSFFDASRNINRSAHLLQDDSLRPAVAAEGDGVFAAFDLRLLSFAPVAAIGSAPLKTSLPAAGQELNTAYTFTNGGGDNFYRNGANWSGGVIPDTANGDTAQIVGGHAVNYVPGGDLIIRNGGTLQITNGSFTQTGGNNWMQLQGNGAVLVDGGTYNQGTNSNSPFNVSGTGNVFNVTNGGTANLNNGFNVRAGLTSTINNGTLNVTGGETQVNSSLTISGSSTASLSGALTVNSSGTLLVSGGTVTVGGNLVGAGSLTLSGGTVTVSGETQFNNATNYLTGGTLNTPLITGVNGGGSPHVFSISGGLLNLTGAAHNGIYGGGLTQYLNFTVGSSGEILFSNGASVSVVQGFIMSNVIQYDNTPYSSSTGYSNFVFGEENGFTTLGVVPIPEPATWAAALLSFGVVSWTQRRHLMPHKRLRSAV